MGGSVGGAWVGVSGRKRGVSGVWAGCGRGVGGVWAGRGRGVGGAWS